MRKGLNGLGIILLVLSLMIWIPVTAMADEVPQNMRFDPLPHVGDTSLSGTCDQTQGCDGIVQVVIATGGVPGQDVGVLGEGTCEGGRFTIDLCSKSEGSSPTGGCLPYALKAGDVISAGQLLDDKLGTLAQPLQPIDLCDTAPWFTVGAGAGIPTIGQWGMIILSILLALSAIVLIRRRRRA
jgi:hypothetical protein